MKLSQSKFGSTGNGGPASAPRKKQSASRSDKHQHRKTTEYREHDRLASYADMYAGKLGFGDYVHVSLEPEGASSVARGHFLRALEARAPEIMERIWDLIEPLDAAVPSMTVGRRQSPEWCRSVFGRGPKNWKHEPPPIVAFLNEALNWSQKHRMNEPWLMGAVFGMLWRRMEAFDDDYIRGRQDLARFVEGGPIERPDPLPPIEYPTEDEARERAGYGWGSRTGYMGVGTARRLYTAEWIHEEPKYVVTEEPGRWIFRFDTFGYDPLVHHRRKYGEARGYRQVIIERFVEALDHYLDDTEEYALSIGLKRAVTYKQIDHFIWAVERYVLGMTLDQIGGRAREGAATHRDLSPAAIHKATDKVRQLVGIKPEPR